jgi:hypothetical protein
MLLKITNVFISLASYRLALLLHFRKLSGVKSWPVADYNVSDVSIRFLVHLGKNSNYTKVNMINKFVMMIY